MNHAIRENMTKVVLLSGDRDFKPLVENRVQVGIDVWIWSDISSTSKEFIWAVDSHRKITLADYYSWSLKSLKAKYPIPDVSLNQNSPPTGYSLVRKDSDLKYNVHLYQSKQNFIAYFPISENAYGEDSYSLTIKFHDVERLELYFLLQFGKKILWH